MGCDIHTYVEYAEWTQRDGLPYWSNFTKNGGSRNYLMFGVLAGVRVPDVQLFSPKGMPEGSMGYGTADDYWLSVAPDAHPEWADTEGYTDIESATRWVESGYSTGERDDNGRLRRVSGPDWHSHSWLTLAEHKQAMSHYQSVISEQYPGEDKTVPSEWLAMAAAMQAFEDAGKQTRLIFWFDN